jgi:hypothetical protein
MRPKHIISLATKAKKSKAHLVAYHARQEANHEVFARRAGRAANVHQHRHGKASGLEGERNGARCQQAPPLDHPGGQEGGGEAEKGARAAEPSDDLGADACGE